MATARVTQQYVEIAYVEHRAARVTQQYIEVAYLDIAPEPPWFYIGATPIINVYIGTKEIDTIYIGSTEVPKP
jgi:hypothetical protein